MSTLSNLRGLTRGEVKNLDPNGRVWSDSEIDNAVNNALADIQAAGAFSWPENQAETTVAVQAGVAEYDLPARFVSVRAARAARFSPKASSKEATVLSGPSSSTPHSFYVWKRKLGLYPTPIESDALTLAYSEAHPKLTDTVDCSFPEEFDQAIACRAAYYVIRSRPNLNTVAEAKKNQSDQDIASLYSQNRYRISGAYGTF